MIEWTKTEVNGTTLVRVETTSGYIAEFIGIGATSASFYAPDRSGKLDNIVLGYDKLDEYRSKRNFFGVTAGRFANRIGNGTFFCNGHKYQLDCNDRINHLHGGNEGFDLKEWQTEVFARKDSVSIVFTFTSPDGDQGYPGNMTVTSTYVMDDDGTLSMEYYAETDALTPVNLTNHSYWNLAGGGSGSIENHALKLNCAEILEFDDTQIPTGKILKVDGTPFDFRDGKVIGKDLKAAGGYDHCFVLPPTEGDMRFCAELDEPVSGRRMTIETTQPGIQFYTGNSLTHTIGKDGKTYEKMGGLCLETQNFPDAVNHPEFPNGFLSPGETYQQRTVHRFSFF